MILILAFLNRGKRISAIMKRMVEELFSSQNRKSLRLRVKVGVLLDMSNSLVFSKIGLYPLGFWIECSGHHFAGPRKGHVVIRGAPDKLMDQLMVENSTTDPTYIEDFLLTYRTFLNAPVVIADQLLDWFKVSELSKDVC